MQSNANKERIRAISPCLVELLEIVEPHVTEDLLAQTRLPPPEEDEATDRWLFAWSREKDVPVTPEICRSLLPRIAALGLCLTNHEKFGLPPALSVGNKLSVGIALIEMRTRWKSILRSADSHRN